VNSFPIPKKTGTYADVLAAAGLADLLSSIRIAQQTLKSEIIDRGTHFEVRTDSDIQGLPSSMGCDPGFQYVDVPSKQAKGVPSEIPRGLVLDYAAEKERETRYRAALKMRKQRKDSQAAMDAEADRPGEDWYLYKCLNALQGDGATNKAVLRIVGDDPANWRKELWAALTALAAGGSPDGGFDCSLVQLFSPQAAKGYARLKPDKTDRNDKTKDSWAEPFLEWLRYRGYFRIAVPFFLGQKREHVRLLCPEPQNISIRMLENVVAALRKRSIFGTAVKIDCLGTLALAELLIEYSPEFNAGFVEPGDLVSGVMVVQFQSMGQAKAVTKMERLALPGWFKLNNTADADLWRETLNEHSSVLRRLNDKNSDELGILQLYRGYLQRRGQQATLNLLAFMEAYGIFVLRERGQNHWWYKQFLANRLEAILSEDLSYREILNNPGFRAIAWALRTSTVSAQSRKRNRMDYREIRYDILPELRRKRSLPTAAPFIEAITDFVASFNAESARRLEQNKPTAKRRLLTDDLESFLSLFEGRKDALLIGAMLCAYATCREPQERDAEDQAEAEPSQEELEAEEPNVEA
jgi:hypothetical protein